MLPTMLRTLGTTLALCALGVILATGCSQATRLHYPHSEQVTTGETSAEHHARVLRGTSHDRRLLADDLDLFFMTDRPTRLTRWHAK